MAARMDHFRQFKFLGKVSTSLSAFNLLAKNAFAAKYGIVTMSTLSSGRRVGSDFHLAAQLDHAVGG